MWRRISAKIGLKPIKLQFIGLLGFLCKGGLGAKPPDPNTVAGSPEGGLERLGAHRKVQGNYELLWN